MKFKKILSGVLASALLVSAMPVFSASAADKDPNGNSILDPIEIKFNEIVSGVAESSSDNDWYKFTLSSAGKVTMTLTKQGSLMFALVNGDDEATVLDEKYHESAKTNIYYLTAGDYYIRINESTWTGTEYDLQLKFTPSDVTLDSEDNNTIAKAAAVEYDGTVYNGQLSLNDSIDYYTFDVAEQGRVTLKFDSPMANTEWGIYDSEDILIKKGVFVKGEQDSGISAKESNIMKAGKYTLVFKKKDSYGNYSFSLDHLKNYNDISVSGIITAADLNEDGSIDSSDASIILAYYSYLQTGGTETDLSKWLALTNKK